MLKMKKACMNSTCRAYTDKLNCTNEDMYCTKCGQKLYHVCKAKNCYEILNCDTDSLCIKHRLEQEQKKEQQKEHLQKAKEVVAGAAIPIVLKNPKKLKDGAKLALRIIKK